MRRVVWVLMALLAGCDGVGSRQSAVVSELSAVPAGSLGLGQAPTAEELAAWDKSVNPTGKNLPPGQGTVADGKLVYATKCAACHGAAGEGTPPVYPKLVDPQPADFSFDTDFKLTRTIGNYWPYATTLYDYINRAMPLTAPGSLTPQEIYAVTAYLLAANGVIAEDAVMDATTLPKVKMPAHDRFVVDDRAGGTTFR